MAEQRKAVIKNADMSEPMQQDAVDVASIALSKYNIEKVRFQSKACRISFHLFSRSDCFSHPKFSFLPFTGRCCLYQEGIRQKAQPNLVRSHFVVLFRCLVAIGFGLFLTILFILLVQARDCWTKLWKLCDARDKALYIFLPWPSCDSFVQEWITMHGDCN